MQKSVRYGVLGTGRMAARMVPYIGESSNSGVYAVASTSAEKAKAFARQFNIGQAYGDYLSLLKDPRVDAVYIALPNSMHFAVCKQALELGKHVLCEKPLVLESEQVDLLAKLAKKRNLKIMECFWYRFHPLIDSVIRSVAQDLGAPLGFYSNFSFLSAAENDIRWNPALGGGALYDLMCYHLDAVNYIFKRDVSQWRNLEAISRQRNGVEANIFIEALLEGDFQVNLCSSIDRPSINRTTIVGTKATLVIPNLRMSPDIKESFFYLVKNSEMRKIACKTANPYVEMARAFSNAILTDAPAPIGLDESEKNILLIEAIKRSLRLEMSDRVALYPKAKRKFGTLVSKLKRKWSM